MRTLYLTERLCKYYKKCGEGSCSGRSQKNGVGRNCYLPSPGIKRRDERIKRGLQSKL